MNEISTLLNKRNNGSFNQLGNKVSAISRFVYITEIMPNIENYALTDKADGERAFIFNRGRPELITATAVKAIAVKDTGTNAAAGVPNGIFDCELIDDKPHIFDVLEYNGINTSVKSFKERLQIISGLKPTAAFAVKKYYLLSSKNYKESIKSAYGKAAYEKDGLIFTSLDKNYNMTKNLKWKPQEHLTIDFLYKNNTLNVGMTRRAWHQYGFPTTVPSGDYFAVPFVCSLGDFSAPVFVKKPPIKEGEIIELSWNNQKKAWNYHRTRLDRMREIATGTYFGNNYKIAEETLQMSLNPLTFADLVASYDALQKNFYFSKEDDLYKNVRKYNNYVKKLLIAQYATGLSRVFDMGSGKGQDLQKYADATVKELFMVDVDINAIDEILRRKYDILGKLPFGQKMILHIRRMDLTAITGAPADLGTFDAVFSNFAFHYLVENKKSMKNICDFINRILKQGGVFVFTALDGERVFAAIKDAPFRHEDKYLIELKSRSERFKGFEQIKVRLPCDDVPKKEKLINIAELDKVMSKLNIVRICSRQFGYAFDEFKKYRPHFYDALTGHDREFINMYSYHVYRKH